MGAYLAGLCEEIDFVVCDTAGICDTNAAAFSFAAAFLGKPFYQLNYPPTLVEGRSTIYHRDDFMGLIAFIEKQTGKKLNQEQLRDILEEIHVQDELIAELEEMQRLAPSPLPATYNLFFYTSRFSFAGKPECTDIYREMIKTAKQNADAGICGLRSGKEKGRALFCYIDHYIYNLRLWDWLDRHGVMHMGSILSRFFPDNAPYIGTRADEAYHIDTSSLDAMINSIAQLNSRMPMVRTIRGPYDAPHMWLDDTLALAKFYQADCIVYNGTPGCRNTWAMVKPFARDMEKHGYPTHVMYADAFDERIESWEATAERLYEFFQVRRLLS